MAQQPLAPLPRVALFVPLAGVAIVGFGVLINARAAVLLFAAFAIAGAVARMVAPPSRAFAVRSRTVDVAVLGVLGAGLGLLGMTTPLG